MNAAEARHFLEQFEHSKAEVQRMKRDTPYLFPEWQRLKAAEETFWQASEALERARRAWGEA